MASGLRWDLPDPTVSISSDPRLFELDRSTRAPNEVRHDLDEWFEALDQRSVDFWGEHSIVQILGIHEDGANLWIQIERVDVRRSGVMRVWAGISLDEALVAIKAALQNDTDDESSVTQPA
jgi:hypothetical protein